MEQPLPPTPLHLLRVHSSPVTAIAYSDDNERIYSGDTSGKVVVTSTRSLRAIASWNAHTDSVLGVEEWDYQVITHARDNKIHVWGRMEEPPLSSRIGGVAGISDMQATTPKHCYSMDVNALNFCRFSLLKASTGQQLGLIAVPNLVDSTTVDIWSLPSQERMHAAVGQEVSKSLFSENPGARNNSGIVMSIHVYRNLITSSEPSSSSMTGNLRLLAAYENGSVVLREYTRSSKDMSVEGRGWDVIWKFKLHVETIMAMKVSRVNYFALTVSADHIIGYYDLTEDKPRDSRGVAHRTKHPGNGSVAIRDDGKVCAVGGWDGKIRLYSTKSFKPLGTLRYHKEAAQCIQFSRSLYNPGCAGDVDIEDDDSEDNLTQAEQMERSGWLLVGSKDSRLSIWSLIDFSR
ncbi:WD40-repeat-containing domain protein [Crepidotus variabilis]|uniref:ASTRA-associated protein 1 n=1 Tax=Crepidotus variabilis TaxID=179855 RepID=A0A9P6EMI3_9AGAR|nr:WD40-repeat-containing domain protein [Crepidotus variabilis]